MHHFNIKNIISLRLWKTIPHSPHSCSCYTYTHLSHEPLMLRSDAIQVSGCHSNCSPCPSVLHLNRFERPDTRKQTHATSPQTINNINCTWCIYVYKYKCSIFQSIVCKWLLWIWLISNAYTFLGWWRTKPGSSHQSIHGPLSSAARKTSGLVHHSHSGTPVFLIWLCCSYARTLGSSTRRRDRVRGCNAKTWNKGGGGIYGRWRRINMFNHLPYVHLSFIYSMLPDVSCWLTLIISAAVSINQSRTELIPLIIFFPFIGF